MTDFTHEWIAKREELEEAATEGPWEYLSKNVIETPVIDVSESNWGGEDLHGYRLVAWQDSGAWRNEDAEFIADARTSLPAALAALKAVLGMRTPAGAERFGPDFEAGMAKGLQLARAAIEAALRGES